MLRATTSAAKCFFTSIRIPPEHASKHPRAAFPTSRTHALFARYSSSNSAISDPSRPDLFYHHVSLPTIGSVYAVSFLAQPPPTPDSCSVMGWLPAETAGEGDAEAGLNDFRREPERVDDIWMNGALQLQQGWMHIHDSRNLPALGRIGDPDDIIASVLVRDSIVLGRFFPRRTSLCHLIAFALLMAQHFLQKGLASKVEVSARGSHRSRGSPVTSLVAAYHHGHPQPHRL
ncbi:hypothetical protein EDB19DRAFT_2021894 [Suillus lakei]|nr:hypothetical protein EDB19DRAFT_2021894 [Suillus lakei]